MPKHHCSPSSFGYSLYHSEFFSYFSADHEFLTSLLAPSRLSNSTLCVRDTRKTAYIAAVVLSSCLEKKLAVAPRKILRSGMSTLFPRRQRRRLSFYKLTCLANLRQGLPFRPARVALPPFNYCAMGKSWAVDKPAWCRGGVISRVARWLLKSNLASTPSRAR